MQAPPSLWDVRLREQAEEMVLHRQIEAVSTELEFIRRAEAIKAAPGFDAFVKQLEKIRDFSMRKLASDKTLSDSAMREQRGYVQAVGDILGMVTSSKATETLAERLTSLQDQLNEAHKRRPKPREATA